MQRDTSHAERLEEAAKCLRLSGMTDEAAMNTARLVVGRELFSERIVNAIARERERQEALCAAGKFPATCADPNRTHLEKLPVLLEEVGEVARVLCEEGGATDVRGKDLRAELVQVAAVAVAWIEAIDAKAANRG